MLIKNTLVIQRVYSHLHVACCNQDQDFWAVKVCLIAWSSLQKLLISWSKIELEPSVPDPLFVLVQRLPWSLDRLSKWALIAWFNFDPILILVVNVPTWDMWLPWNRKTCTGLVSREIIVLKFTRGCKNDLATFPEEGGEESVGWRLYM